MDFEEYHFDEQNDQNKNIIVNSSVDFLSQLTPIDHTPISTIFIATLDLELEFSCLSNEHSREGVKRKLSDTLDRK